MSLHTKGPRGRGGTSPRVGTQPFRPRAPVPRRTGKCCPKRKVTCNCPPGVSPCVTLTFSWATPVQDIFIDLSIPFNPAVSFNPAPDVLDPKCCDPQGSPQFSRCIFLSPGLNHADPSKAFIDPFALERLGDCQFVLAFACPFAGEICFQFCCRGCNCT